MIDNLTETLATTDGVHDDEISRFMKFITEEEYDSDSVFDDIESTQISTSNIFINCCLTKSQSVSSSPSIFARTLYKNIHHKKCMLDYIFHYSLFCVLFILSTDSILCCVWLFSDRSII